MELEYDELVFRIVLERLFLEVYIAMFQAPCIELVCQAVVDRNHIYAVVGLRRLHELV